MGMGIEKEILDGINNCSNLKPFEDRMLRLIIKRNILLRDESSNIFPLRIPRAICKELLRDSLVHFKLTSLLKIIFLPQIKSTKKDSQALIQRLSCLFYPVERLLQLIYKFCYRLGRNIVKKVFHKMVVKLAR